MKVIDPELLMRYADDEVSLTERSYVEARLATDRRTREEVEAFRQQRVELRDALAATDDDLGLRRCERAIDKAFADERANKVNVAMRRFAMPLAASLMITLIGGALSLHLAERKVENEIAAFLANQAADRDLLIQSRSEALEMMLSGSSLTWTNDQSGTTGSVTPLGTFRRADGAWCRDYQEEITSFSSSSAERRHGVACRDDDGGWSPPAEPLHGV